MNQTLTATFENGVFLPDERVDLPAHARVRLTVESLPVSSTLQADAWQELERLCEEAPVDSGGILLTRDQLHERR